MLKKDMVQSKSFKFIQQLNSNIMENKDLGDKKINGKQELNEGFSSENSAENFGSEESRLKTEIETDVNGNKKTVERARHVAGTISEENERNWNENESLSRGVGTEEAVKKTVENKDRNSDIIPNRYPNSHPDNHKDRGNIKLDQ